MGQVSATPRPDARIAPSTAGSVGPPHASPLQQPPAGPSYPAPASGSRPRRRRWLLIAVIAALLAAVAAVVFAIVPRSQADIGVDAIDVPDSIVAGEDLEVNVHLRNAGDADGEQTLTLLVDGTRSETATVAVVADADETLALTASGLPPGVHALAIDEFEDLAASVRVLVPATIAVDELTVTPSEVDLAIDPVVTAEVGFTNSGEVGGSRDLQLRVDGQLVDHREVTVGAGESGQETFTLTMDTPGHPVIGVEDATAEIWVLTPATFVIDELVVSPPEVDLAVDPTVTADVRFTNVGEIDGSHELQITVDGQVVDQREVTLAAGEAGQETFTVTMETPGRPVIGVDDVTAEIWVVKPAELTIGTIEVTPPQPDLTIGNVATVSVPLSNVGERDGTFSIDVTHDGTVVETRNVTLTAGQTVTEPFTITLARPGPQVVSVNGTQLEIAVIQTARPDDGTVLVDVLGGGPNELTIVNERDQDVYVVLTASGDGQPPLFGVYVHAGSTQTVGNIPRGVYATYFAHGSAWDTFSGRFTKDADYGRFDEDSWFESDDVSYTEITLTFGSTVGSSPTSSVDPDLFPS